MSANVIETIKMYMEHDEYGKVRAAKIECTILVGGALKDRDDTAVKEVYQYAANDGIKKWNPSLFRAIKKEYDIRGLGR